MHNLVRLIISVHYTCIERWPLRGSCVRCYSDRVSEPWMNSPKFMPLERDGGDVENICKERENRESC